MSGGGHAAVFGTPGSGSFFLEYHDAQALDTGYVEVRAVDGSITRYQKFCSVGDNDYLQPVEQVDPYDNVTTLEYQAGRLWKVHHPSGIDEEWNYSPSWIGVGGWDPLVYSGIEVTYTDTLSPAEDLTSKTRALLFYRRTDAQGSLVLGSKPFAGDRLFRVYHAKSRVLDDVAPGASQYVVPANHLLPSRFRVLELEYCEGSDLVKIIGQRVVDGLLPSSVQSSRKDLFEYTYTAIDGLPRVATETVRPSGIVHTFAYTPDSSRPHLLDIVEIYDSLGGKVTRVLDDQHRVTQLVIEPPASMPGPTRSTDPDNGGCVEPAAITYNYQYSSCASCGDRPTLIEELPSGRRTEYEYDAVSGLMTKERVSNPAGGTGLVETTYQWQPAVPGEVYGAYNLVSVTHPDGRQWTYDYVSVPRLTPLGRASWGVKHQWTTFTSPDVNTADGGQAPIVEQEEYNINTPPVSGGLQVGLVGQKVKTIDGDGVTTELAYNTVGTLTSVTDNPGGGDMEVVTLYTCDRWGTIKKVTENATSTLSRVTDLAIDGAGMLIGASTTVGGQLLETKYFHDRWGNLAVRLRKNRTSSGGAPNDFGQQNRSDTAREWLWDEWHYEGDRLITVLRDRRALDRDNDTADAVSDALDARYVREDMIWGPQEIESIAHANGSLTTFTYDGYGTLYKAERVSSGQPTVLLGKWFVNNALEVVREFRGGADATLVTTINRNHAGFVTSVVEPNWTPAGYAWVTDPATHTQVRDVMGRLTETSVAGLSGTLARTLYKRDEIGRVWKVERYEGAAALPTQAFITTWTGATKAKKSEGPAGRFVARTFDAMARVTEVVNSMPGNPDKVSYEFLPKTHYLKAAKGLNWDPLATPAGYVSRDVEYVRDGLGRATQVKVGPSASALLHQFSYYSTGATESYVDPSGKTERYLPDAMGRLTERFLPGTDPIWNETDHRDWTGQNDGTELRQRDGRDRLTRTVFDHAGRAQFVMEPGASTEPTAASPHQSFARLLEYDSASRLLHVAAGDDVKVRFDRDGVGRILMRTRVTATHPLVSSTYGRDEVRWNALGQMVETISRTGFGPAGVGDKYIHEHFDRDAVGRLHEEQFEFTGAANAVEISGEFVGDDPFRSALTYRNNLGGGTDDLWFRYVPDAVGRLQSIDWKASGASAWTPSAEYQHEGSVTRRRTTHWDLGGSTPGNFDTTYQYDLYGRMKRIEQSFSATAEVQFEYDLASNLVKEWHSKQGGPGRVGDRFAYDEHHRLTRAWLGSNQAHMDEGDPESGVGAFVKKLTYGLDAANNRASVQTQTGQGGSTTTSTYTTQDAAPQGPSNRYDTVAGVQVLYDARGNTIFDGRFYYLYDALGRLTEVYAIEYSGDGQALGGGGGQPSSPVPEGERSFVLSDATALRLARSNIVARTANAPAEVLFRVADPAYVANLKEPVSAAVLEPTELAAGATEGTYQLVLSAIYLYDVMNRRVVRLVVDDATYYYAWDGWQEAQELTQEWSGTAFVAKPLGQCAWGEQVDELVSYRTNVSGAWASYYIAEGGAHCPSRALDSSGNVVEVQEYEPYGEAKFWAGGNPNDASSHGNSFGWKGHRLDAESGLVYMRNRYYSPLSGRFLTGDPLGVWADRYVMGNHYDYAGGNPLTRHDFLGLQIYNGRVLKPNDLARPIEDMVAETVNFLWGTAQGGAEAVKDAGDGVVKNVVETGKYALAVATGDIPLGKAAEDTLTGVVSAPGHLAAGIQKEGQDLFSGDPRRMGHAGLNLAASVLGLRAATGALKAKGGYKGPGDAVPPPPSAAAPRTGAVVSCVREISPQSWVGSSRRVLDIFGSPPGYFDGRWYTGHAVDRMRGRGIPPSVVENTIGTGVKTPGKGEHVGTTRHYDPSNGVAVVTNDVSGSVITVMYR